jgi:predicted nucleic acid-binding Zn ribbon protein
VNGPADDVNADGRRRSARDAPEPVPLSESLKAFSRRMGLAEPDVLHIVFGRWEEVVGINVSAHVRPLRLQETTLVVVADHPAWATQIRHLAPEILSRLRDVCGAASTPERLEVRVRA